jgi:hypothetical protein
VGISRIIVRFVPDWDIAKIIIRRIAMRILESTELGIKIDYRVYITKPTFNTKIKPIEIQLIADSNCYHVKVFNYDTKERIIWDSFDYLKEARKKYHNIQAEIMQELLCEYFNNTISGSGIDSEFTKGRIQKNSKFKITSSFHCMNENGFYAGWQDFTLVFDPTDLSNFRLHFTGNRNLERRYMLRDYLEELVYYSVERFIELNIN